MQWGPAEHRSNKYKGVGRLANLGMGSSVKFNLVTVSWRKYCFGLSLWINLSHLNQYYHECFLSSIFIIFLNSVHTNTSSPQSNS